MSEITECISFFLMYWQAKIVWFCKRFFSVSNMKRMKKIKIIINLFISADSPCQKSKHNCQHICYLGSNKIQQCACRRGYLLGDDGDSCKGRYNFINLRNYTGPVSIHLESDKFNWISLHLVWGKREGIRAYHVYCSPCSRWHQIVFLI